MPVTKLMYLMAETLDSETVFMCIDSDPLGWIFASYV